MACRRVPSVTAALLLCAIFAQSVTAQGAIRRRRAAVRSGRAASGLLGVQLGFLGWTPAYGSRFWAL